MASSLPPSSIAKIKTLLNTIKTKLDKEGSSSSTGSSTNDPPPSPPISFAEGVAWLLELELVQRGEIISTQTPTSSASVMTATNKPILISVLESVQSAAGKVLLTAPPPLLAGASVLQARVAEKLILLLFLHPTTTTSNRGGGSSDTGSAVDASSLTMIRKVVDRCHQVEDDRFLAIASLLLILSEDAVMMESWLSYMAEGCYYRAASLVDNPPMWKGAWDVIVRRSATTTSARLPERLQGNWEAAHALENLNRIAAAKGNAKRQAELSLALVECLLEGTGEPNAQGSSSSSLVKSTNKNVTNLTASLNTVVQAFVAPYRSTQPPPRTLALETTCAHHLQLLQNNNSNNSLLLQDDDKNNNYCMLLRLKTLQVRWCLEVRANRIHQAAIALYAAAKNRVKEGKNKPTTTTINNNLSLDEFISQARRDYYLTEDQDDELNSRAHQLLEQVLLLPSSTAPTAATATTSTAGEDDTRSDSTSSRNQHEYYYWYACRCLVMDYLVTWHMDRAKVKAQNLLLEKGGKTAIKGYKDDIPAATVELLLHEWRIGSDVLTCLLTHWEQNGVISLSSHKDNSPDNMYFVLTENVVAEQAKIIQQVVLLVPFIEWMSSSLVMAQKSTMTLFSISYLRMARDLLNQRHRQLASTLPASSSSELSSSQAASNNRVVLSSSSTSAHSRECWRTNMAYRSARAFVYLAETKTGSDDDSMIRYASSYLGDSNDENTVDCEFGTAMLEFAISWSGLHRIAWSHCVASADARILVKKARSCVAAATSEWGRHSCFTEKLILTLGQADADGLLTEAQRLYTQVLETVTKSPVSLDQTCAVIIRSKCYSGLVGLSLRHSSTTCSSILGVTLPSEDMTPEDLARRNLQTLLTLDMDQSALSPLYLWKSTEATKSSIRFLLAFVRQQVADCLLRKNLTSEAQSFLEDAVEASPNDAVAALSLGAFRLRVMFFGENRSAPDLAKAAQIQLLKAAKLDSNKSSPFALLGYWFEFAGDENRALGCYSKALLLDPWHPVAGRGLLRLKHRDSLLPSLEKATEGGSPLAGWAWRALGVHKAMVEGNDDLAVVSLLQALRCRDIQNPSSESLSIFFASPFSPKEADRQDFVKASAELASSYRRLGRFTASLRSYYAAIEAAGESATGTLLNACANVEMELGLFDEASEKLELAMNKEENQVQSISAYALSKCLLSMAKRDAQDGKAGAAYGYLKRGIDCCPKLDAQSGCVQKLLGDLFSFGALLPPSVFCDDKVPNSATVVQAEDMVRSQLSFVSAGAEAYCAAENAIHGSTPEETQVLRACVVADAGANLLLQAQILSFWQSKGVQLVSLESEKTYEKAQAEFRRALDISPLYQSAWCGLGCALQKVDPVLAQHAFCRSIELDHLFPEAYANLSFLYTTNGAFDHSASVSDALTQVADTPMMWINRALILERQQVVQSNDVMDQAADAYRAALQVAPLPAAKNGLAMTRRIDGVENSGRASCEESHCLLFEYLDATGSLDVLSLVLCGLSNLESGATLCWSESQRLIDLGRQQIAEGLQTLDASGYREGYLDVERFRPLQVPVESHGENAVARVNQNATILKQQLMLEPNRGDLWLALAKVLVRQGSVSASALRAATQAAHKASSMLIGQATDPSLRFNKKTCIPARELSDALSLRYWLDRVRFNHSHIDGATFKTCNPPSTVELQRALILCPDISLAREAIKQIY